MPPGTSSSPRRRLLAASAAASAFGLALLAISLNARRVPAAERASDSKGTRSTPGTTEVRPFQVHVPEEALMDLRRRLAATRWPDKELVGDRSQVEAFTRHRTPPRSQS